MFSFQPGSAGSEVGVGGSSSSEASGVVEVVRPPLSGPWDYALLSGIGSTVKRVPSLLPDSEDELPPLLITTGEDEAGGVCLFQWIYTVSVVVELISNMHIFMKTCWQFCLLFGKSNVKISAELFSVKVTSTRLGGKKVK